MSISSLRLAVRRLSRQPAFTLAAVVTLALGIGANLSVFAYVQALLLDPVNAPEPHRLVRVAEVTASRDGTTIVSWLNYVDMRDGVRAADLSAHGPATAQIGTGERSDVRPIELVSSNYFRVLGQVPALGRFIDDDVSKAEKMVRAKVDSVVAERVEPVRKQILAVRSEAESRLASERKQVEDVERELQAELKRLTGGLAPEIKLPKIGI